MQYQNDDNGYYVEPVVDDARRHRYLIKVIAAGAIAAVATMIWTFMR